jgi:hypothetical protein
MAWPLKILVVGILVAAATIGIAHAGLVGRGPGPITAREWNSTAIARMAKRIPAPHIGSGDWVEVPKWNAYLRLALLGNQDPHKRRYRDTYLRCWSRPTWSYLSQGNWLLGFYLRGSWIHVPISTCVNARKAARGSLSPTTIVALGTVLHETFHRQGIRREDHATCLAAVGVWQAVNRHVGEARANRAWTLVIDWYQRHLTGDYHRGLDRCAERAAFSWNDTRVWS